MKEIAIVLDSNAQTKPIKDGTLTAPDLKLNFTEYKPISKAFDVQLSTMPYDVCEMALVTFLQGLDAGRKMKLMPVVMGGEFHHGSIWYNPSLGRMVPQDLKGRKVGVRAYTQTTGAWVRGVLYEQFGVSSKDVTWVTTEAPHVADYRNPANVVIQEGANLADMVRSGELAAVIQGSKQGAPEGLDHLIPDLDKTIDAWWNRHHCAMINHMVSYKEGTDMDAIHEIYDLLVKGLEMAYPLDQRGERFALVNGVDKVWEGIETCQTYALEQQLISRRFSKEEIFDESFF